MSRSTIAADMPLRQFLIEHLFPTQKRESKEQRKNFINAHNRLRLQLGRDPLLSDLTPTAFTTFLAWLAPRYKFKTIETSSVAFRQAWKFARSLGLDLESPPDKRTGRPQSLWSKTTIEPVEPGEPPKTVRQCFVFFYQRLALRGCSPKTIAKYKVSIDHLHKFLGHDPLLSDLRDEPIGAFFQSIVEAGKSPASANGVRNQILAVWRFAARKRFVEQFPEIPPMVEPVRIPRGRSREELDRLMAAIEKLTGKVGQVNARSWWRALHLVAFFTGERIGAMMQLEWRDIDLDSQWVIVRAETRKFGAADKATKLPASVIDSLRRIQHPRRKLVFEFPHHPSTLYNRYGKILERAGLSNDRRSKFHSIRRSAASHLKALGGDAQALLGHSSSKTTAGYLDPRICPPPQAADLLFTPGGEA